MILNTERDCKCEEREEGSRIETRESEVEEVEKMRNPEDGPGSCYEGFGWALALSIRSGRQSAPWAGGARGGVGVSGPIRADTG